MPPFFSFAHIKKLIMMQKLERRTAGLKPTWTGHADRAKDDLIFFLKQRWQTYLLLQATGHLSLTNEQAGRITF